MNVTYALYVVLCWKYSAITARCCSKAPIDMDAVPTLDVGGPLHRQAIPAEREGAAAVEEQEEEGGEGAPALPRRPNEMVVASRVAGGILRGDIDPDSLDQPPSGAEGGGETEGQGAMRTISVGAVSSAVFAEYTEMSRPEPEPEPEPEPQSSAAQPPPQQEEEAVEEDGHGHGHGHGRDESCADGLRHLWHVPSTTHKRAAWLISLPLLTVFSLTIPDCRNKRFEKSAAALPNAWHTLLRACRVCWWC